MDQVSPVRLRGHRDDVLLVVLGTRALRAGHGVSGELDWAAVHSAHQRVRGREGRARATDVPGVRPICGIPLVHLPVDQGLGAVPGGRGRRAGVQEPGRASAGVQVPEGSGDDGVREHLGRQPVGYSGREGEDQL